MAAKVGEKGGRNKHTWDALRSTHRYTHDKEGVKENGLKMSSCPILGCTLNHVNLTLLTENSFLPHESLHDRVLDPKQSRFQCCIVLPSGTAAPQQ